MAARNNVHIKNKFSLMLSGNQIQSLELLAKGELDKMIIGMFCEKVNGIRK